MPTIITEHQSTFTKNRLIYDNILAAFESLHSMNNMRSGKSGYMTIKLDMSKAYDRVEWGYLENIMRKMGFNERWIGLIMACVKIVSYSILINGQPQGFIQPSRGICQGDPLSHFLPSLHRRPPWPYPTSCKFVRNQGLPSLLERPNTNSFIVCR